MTSDRLGQQNNREEAGQNFFIPFFYHQLTSQMIEHAHKKQVFFWATREINCRRMITGKQKYSTNKTIFKCTLLMHKLKRTKEENIPLAASVNKICLHDKQKKAELKPLDLNTTY
jgi:hypothetical protein